MKDITISPKKQNDYSFIVCKEGKKIGEIYHTLKVYDRKSNAWYINVRDKNDVNIITQKDSFPEAKHFVYLLAKEGKL